LCPLLPVLPPWWRLQLGLARGLKQQPQQLAKKIGGVSRITGADSDVPLHPLIFQLS
jgi:hypothetical protein